MTALILASIQSIFQPLIDVFKSVLVFFDGIVNSWGLSIILLTVVVRAALIPLTLKQFRSMQNMARLSPEIKQLQAKYKDDKERLNQEMMKFYKENQVNPLASCLPLVAQLPVFLALFYMLRTDLRIEICGQDKVPCGDIPGSTGQEFLFIPDLTAKATGAVLVTLIVLYVGTQLASSYLSTVTADKNQRRLMLALPFVFVVFVINFPAGLLVYWITTNAWTIVQQYIVRKRVGPLRPPEVAAAPAGALSTVATAGAGGGGGGSGGAAGGGNRGKSKGSAARSATTERRRSGPPPPSPRKKKKRSGRRR